MRLISLFMVLFVFSCNPPKDKSIVVGAEQADLYLPLLNGKNVGVVANNTALVHNQHLVDFLLSKQISIKKIFAPEHGFRGNTSAGKDISDGIDTKTGIPIFSLYGKNTKPSVESLEDLDVIIFDIQDVGCRFYTYISTLHFVVEACAENNIPLIVLDRPNPNGDYIGGPIRKEEFISFVGMDPIPVVHGCTIGEYAKMVDGEQWTSTNKKCDITVIPVKNYNHKIKYSLPVKPSPNLPNDLSIRLYPSLCMFEATDVSVGRGTEFPFQVLGSPKSNLREYSFTPKSIKGVSINPPHKDEECFGIDLRDINPIPEFTLKYFIELYKSYDNKEEFLTREKRLNKLMGDDDVFKQIVEGKTEKEIKKSWEADLNKYKQIRKKYLLYPDFE